MTSRMFFFFCFLFFFLFVFFFVVVFLGGGRLNGIANKPDTHVVSYRDAAVKEHQANVADNILFMLLLFLVFVSVFFFFFFFFHRK